MLFAPGTALYYKARREQGMHEFRAALRHQSGAIGLLQLGHFLGPIAEHFAMLAGQSF